MTDALFALRPVLLALLLTAAAPLLHAQGKSAPLRNGDYIVAIVNQELVTASEVQTRIARVRADAARQRANLPPDEQLQREVLDALIDERVQLTHARDSGQRVDDVELDRAVGNVAVQNQISMAQLRERLATIPADLELAIVRCLAKDPAERHKSAEDLSTALLSVAAAKEWDAALAKLWWQTHQSPAGHPGQRRASPG